MVFDFSTNSSITPNNIYSITVRGYDGGGSGPWFSPCNDWDTNVKMVGEDATTNERFYSSYDSDFEPYLNIEL